MEAVGRDCGGPAGRIGRTGLLPFCFCGDPEYIPLITGRTTITGLLAGGSSIKSSSDKIRGRFREGATTMDGPAAVVVLGSLAGGWEDSAGTDGSADGAGRFTGEGRRDSYREKIRKDKVLNIPTETYLNTPRGLRNLICANNRS